MAEAAARRAAPGALPRTPEYLGNDEARGAQDG
jgi:hypothetical protein